MLDFNWVRGFRIGLWYHDYSDDEVWGDCLWNLAISLDLGLFNIILWIDPKEGAFDEEPPY